MKEFRIARCISEDGKSIERCAIFKDRSRRRPIQVDDKGREYFDVERNRRQRGDLYIAQIMDEEMKPDDPRLR